MSNSTNIEINGVTEVSISDLARTSDDSRSWRTIKVKTNEGQVLELCLWSDNYGLPFTTGEE
jgi:hypothetical protein